MAQIGAEGDKVPGDGICVVRALFQGADRERMPVMPSSALQA